MKRLLPSPWLSLALLGGWLLLQSSISPGQVLIGAMAAVVIPLLARSLRPQPGPLRHWGTLARLVLRVARDVVRSALDVASGVVRSRRHPPRGTFVVVPLDLREPHALAALAVITAVVPGTVWCELAADHSALRLHVFDLADEATFIQHYKRDYEQPLKEIFQ